MAAMAEQFSVGTRVVRPLCSVTRRKTTETTNVSSGSWAVVQIPVSGLISRCRAQICVTYSSSVCQRMVLFHFRIA